MGATIRRAVVAAGLGSAWVLALLMSSSYRASGNPVAPGPDFPTAVDAIAYLFVVNLAADALFFSASLCLVLLVWRRRAGKVSQDSSLFMAAVLVSSLIIAICGAITDFYAFYDGSPEHGYEFWEGHGEPVIRSAEFYLAVLAIFATVYVTSLGLVRLNWRISVIPGGLMAGMNIAAWMLFMDGSMFYTFVLLLSLFAAICVLALLHIAHARVFGTKGAPGSSTTGVDDEKT